MKNIQRYTDKEWSELASILSEEESEQTELLNKFTADDIYDTGKQWKELTNMSKEKELDVNRAWSKVYSKLNENELNTKHSHVRISYLRTTILRIAAIALIMLGLGSASYYLVKSGFLSKKIT